MTNKHTGPGWPTFARELLDARARLTLADHVGLALRAHRRELLLSQRAYARARGISKSLIGKLEAHAEQVTLGTLVVALEATPYRLVLTRHPSADGEGAHVIPVAPEDWERTELLARVRGERRRFPAHGEVRQVSTPPRWWWERESTSARSHAPHWFGPTQKHQRPHGDGVPGDDRDRASERVQGDDRDRASDRFQPDDRFQRDDGVAEDEGRNHVSMSA